MVKYRTIHVLNGLVEEIIDEIKRNNKQGYDSHSVFIIDATRRRLEKVREQRTNREYTTFHWILKNFLLNIVSGKIRNNIS